MLMMHANLQPWRNRNGLHMAKVLTVDPATATCGIELRNGSQPTQAFVLQPNASPTSGWVWLPQVGDICAVAFLDGMDNQPVILGSLYATNDTLHAPHPGDTTLRHQSGTAFVIAADGSLTMTGKAGAVLTLKANGDVEVTHATSGADVTLDANGVTLTQGTVKAQVKSSEILLDANSGGGGAKVEIFPDGHINVTPGAGHQLNLAGGGEFIVRGGDQTSSPIGVGVADHYHLVLASTTSVQSG